MSLPRLNLSNLGFDAELDLLGKILQFAEPVLAFRLAPGLVYVVDEADGPCLLWDDTIQPSRTFLGGFADDILEAEDEGLHCLPCDLLYATEELGSPKRALSYASEIIILPKGVQFYPFPINFREDEWTEAEEMAANYAIEDREEIDRLARDIADIVDKRFRHDTEPQDE